MKHRTLSFTILVVLAAFAAAACGDRGAVGLSERHAAVSYEAGPPAPEQVSRVAELPPATDLAANRAGGGTADGEDIPLPDQAQTAAGGAIAPSMIIRTGRARIEVDSLEVALAQVRALAERLGGYVANSSVQAGDERLRQGTLELKIPAARFEQAVDGLAAIGEVEEVTIDAQDVGEEFVDVTARLENARRLEERLLELLAQQTGELDDVLMVERELARVRERIERYEGRLRYLESRVAVSTLTVNVHEPRPLIGDRPGDNVIVDAFRQAWRNFVGVVAGFIASLGVLIPVAVVLVVAWLIGSRVYRRHRRVARNEE